MTQRKGEKTTISIQEHMAIDVCPGPIQPIKQISDYFPRYPRGLPLTAPPALTRASSLRSPSTGQKSEGPSADVNRDEDDLDQAFGATALVASKKEEEPDVEGYDSDDSNGVNPYSVQPKLACVLMETQVALELERWAMELILDGSGVARTD
ncbi:hypothetical protein DNTS_030287 [Danionella cerebrum]|uniref:Uncharacterized protein n=1 Tax=Danionella cerebrum TaxID=2873325 RepID=A0A553RJU8_9TELE|nr:hypothetical protein DNTS_030287 [Danionella translucida]